MRNEKFFEIYSKKILKEDYEDLSTLNKHELINIILNEFSIDVLDKNVLPFDKNISEDEYIDLIEEILYDKTEQELIQIINNY